MQFNIGDVAVYLMMGNKLIQLVLMLIVAIFNHSASAEYSASKCKSLSNKKLYELDKVYIRDEFRIYYSSAEFYPSPTDFSRDTVPDKVINISKQLVAGRRIFSEVMGMTHPLSQPRYHQAKYIDVNLLSLSKGNGLAYDEVFGYLRHDAVNNDECVLRIDINSKISLGNLTPAHELFHLYQYGYTMFKSPWLLEGTARWAEFAFKSYRYSKQDLPKNEKELEEYLFHKTYDAQEFWLRIAGIVDPVGKTIVPQELRNFYYLGGQRLNVEERIHGADFIRELFEELGMEDKKVARANGWSEILWKESDQRNEIHNTSILNVLHKVLENHINEEHKHGELNDFLSIEISGN
ncbi:hypothetical protein [Zobellella sp. DQSA1]|uniref:hypothetical protein n=1 Tax=Zobellella sp. DQSA1 TaxID=3342386 RepID=UPI0035BF1934